jgi:hypothetical protein
MAPLPNRLDERETQASLRARFETVCKRAHFGGAPLAPDVGS